MIKFPVLGERLYLRSPSINVCFRLIIDKIFEKNEIEKAIEKICTIHPFLNSFLETDNKNGVWLVQKNENIKIEFCKSNESDWQAWYKENDKTVFDFSKGPLVKFCVITGVKTEIIILGHHVIGDGVGYLNMVKDILSALDNKIDTSERAPSAAQIPPFEDKDKYFKDTVLLDAGVDSYAEGLNSEWRKNRIGFSEKEYIDFFEHYRDVFSPALYTASVAADDAGKILEKSKANGLTVNELFASAFSEAAMEKLNKNEIRLGIAANIRGELVSEPNNCMGNFVTGISVKVNNNPSDDFISNAKYVSVLLREQLSNLKNRHLAVHFLGKFDNDLLELIMPAAYGNLDHPVPKKLAELIGELPENKAVGVSNLGRHNFSGFKDFKVLDIQFICPAFPANLITAGIITVNDKFNFCLRYNEAELNADVVQAIWEKAVKLLV